MVVSAACDPRWLPHRFNKSEFKREDGNEIYLYRYLNLCQSTAQGESTEEGSQGIGEDSRCEGGGWKEKDKSGAAGVNEVRVMGMCRSLHSGDQQSLRGKDEWVGTSSLLFIMVGGRTGIHHNHSTTLWWRHRGFPQIQTRTHERDEKE